ncbi:MAG: hypothetical protein JWQ19_2953 [Subtercola sp.]|nr:hypothetical protein [Subtercola sp.]
MRSKEGLAKIAKFILGAANRMPDVAARYFEGHAVMVLGVGAGSTSGIESVEALDIERGIRPYLSVNGPRWDLQRVPVDAGREVLLILVDPPKMGQPPFPCFKDGPGLHNGQIIIRADGETRQATGEEVLQLQHRGRQDRPDVDLAVVVEGRAVLYSCNQGVLEEHIDRESARLLAALRTASLKNPFGMSSVALMASMGQREEKRSEDEYRHEIESWTTACATSWPTAVDAVAAMLTAPTTMTIANREQSFLEDVEVEIHLEGPVRGLRPVSRKRFAQYDLLPSPPRIWGPWVDRSMFSVPNFGSSSYQYAPTVPTLPTVNFRNGGSVNIQVHVGDLRPRQVFRTHKDDLALVVDEDGLTELSGTWKITARGHHAVYEGRLAVPIEPRDMTPVMERLLRRLRKEDVDGGGKGR